MDYTTQEEEVENDLPLDSEASASVLEITENPTENSFKQRKRAPRFTYSENDVLVDEVISNYGKLFGKSTLQNFCSKNREAVWRNIAEIVSTVSGIRRSSYVCKKRFNDCKVTVKRKMSIENKQKNGTGGGPMLSVDFLDWELKLCSKINPQGAVGVTDGIDTASKPTMQRFSSKGSETDRPFKPVLLGNKRPKSNESIKIINQNVPGSTLKKLSVPSMRSITGQKTPSSISNKKTTG